MNKTLIATVAMFVCMAMQATAADLDLTGTSKYYKVHPLFHPYPDEKTAVQSIDRFGPVGIGIFLIQPAFKMQVKNVEPGSPAEATGKLKKEQFIDSINGRVLKDMDPRLILGDIIAKAEASDGVMHLNINQALKMNVNTIDGMDYLFIEAGGFDSKRAPTWKPSLIVMKRGG